MLAVDDRRKLDGTALAEYADSLATELRSLQRELLRSRNDEELQSTISQLALDVQTLDQFLHQQFSSTDPHSTAHQFIPAYNPPPGFILKHLQSVKTRRELYRANPPEHWYSLASQLARLARVVNGVSGIAVNVRRTGRTEEREDGDTGRDERTGDVTRDGGTLTSFSYATCSGGPASTTASRTSVSCAATKARSVKRTVSRADGFGREAFEKKMIV